MYKCKRCGYSASYKCNLKTHYQRKWPCKPIISDISYETCKKIFMKSYNKKAQTETIFMVNDPKEAYIEDLKTSTKMIKLENLVNQMCYDKFPILVTQINENTKTISQLATIAGELIEEIEKLKKS